jgi:transcriptional regulator with XRE-family HTH domain
VNLISTGERMQRLRLERGWSLRRCAKEMGKIKEVSHNAVAKWERGAIPRGEHLTAFCKCFDVSVAWLFGHSEDRTPPDKIETPAHEFLAILDDIRLLNASQVRVLKKTIEAMRWENGQ